MYYGQIKNRDIADGEGVRVTLFVSGCTNRCPGCFQPQTWDFTYGQPFTSETEDHILELLEPNYISGLTLLGGEPMEPENQAALLPFVKRVKAAYPDKTVWCFTGFTLDRLLDPKDPKHTAHTGELLGLIDVLVDGPFVQEKKNLALRFRGSENQRLIDLKTTRETGTLTLLPDRQRGKKE